MGFRYDVHTIGEVERTPQGGLVIPATLTRVGVFEYRQPSGRVIREYRSPEEVFRGDAMASLRDAVVTDTHPSRPVTPKTYRGVAVGHMRGDAVQEGEHVAGTLVVQDATTIAAIDAKKRREVSCGYTCDTDETPGVTPDGERYDRKQINIRYNHVAIVARGRAGSSVRLRLDAADNQIDEEGTNMDPKLEAAIKAQAEAEAKLAAETTRADEADKRADEAEARAIAADEKAKAEGERADAAEAPERVAAIVQLRTDTIDAARLIDSEITTEGTIREIQIAALKKRDDAADFDGRSDDFVSAYFAAVVDGLRAAGDRTDAAGDADKLRTDAAAAASGLGSTPAEDTGPIAARRRMDARNTEAWQAPLAHSQRADA